MVSLATGAVLLTALWSAQLHNTALNWTQILEKNKIPEPPGRPEVIRDIEQRPYKKPIKKKKGK